MTTAAKFQVGQRVKCIDTVPPLVYGDIYTVTAVDLDKVCVSDDHGNDMRRTSTGNNDWYAKRFQAVDDVATVASPPQATQTTSPAINNHTCPTCQNNRCSKAERICWKCGGNL